MRTLARWIAVLPVVALLLAPEEARAEITEFTVEYKVPFGTYGGREYVYIEALMKGTAPREAGPAAPYEVPIELIYPIGGGNDVGLVDLVNTTYFVYYSNQVCSHEDYVGTADGVIACAHGSDSARRLQNEILRMARYHFEDSIFTEGYTYMAVQWDKVVTDAFGPTPPPGERRYLSYGTIELGTDGYEIMRDSSRALRALAAQFPGADAPTAVTHVLGFGQSQTAELLHYFSLNGMNVVGDETTFDGIFMDSSGGYCFALTESGYPGNGSEGLCLGRHVAVDATYKVISTHTQSEGDLMYGDQVRIEDLEDPVLRIYEIAGSSHIPAPFLPADWMGATKQNPGDTRPYLRAAFSHLTDWVVDGTEPPASIYYDGTGTADDGVIEWQYDADGNVTGGIRPVWMPSTTLGGDPAGAPLGVYGGADWDFCGYVCTGGDPVAEPFNVFPLFGGTFVPFSADELAARYPTREDYRALVDRAADDLFARGYILEADRDLLKSEITVPDLPVDPGDDDDEREDDGGGCGCRTDAPSSGAPGALLIGLAIFLGGEAPAPLRRPLEGNPDSEATMSFPRTVDSVALANSLTSTLEDRPRHRVVVHDESLRDGEQTVGVAFSPEVKIDLARRLMAAGVRYMSLGFPAVSEEERETIRAIVRGAPHVSGLSCIARAVKADIDAVVACEIPNVATFIATSDVHLASKLRMTEDEARRRTREAVGLAASRGLRVRFALEDASRTPVERIFKIADDALSAGAVMITVCDTVGILTPLSTYRLVGDLVRRFGHEAICVHLHNDLGMATANTLCAYAAGAGMLQGTLAGIGERAGNTRLEELVVALSVKYGVDLGIDLTALLAAADHVRSLISFPSPPNLPLTGANAFAHESGIHVHGLLAEAATYEPFPPELIGARHSIRYGKHSGLSSLHYLCQENGLSVPDAELNRLLEEVKQRAVGTSPMDEAAIVDRLRGVASPARAAQAGHPGAP